MKVNVVFNFLGMQILQIDAISFLTSASRITISSPINSNKTYLKSIIIFCYGNCCRLYADSRSKTNLMILILDSVFYRILFRICTFSNPQSNHCIFKNHIFTFAAYYIHKRTLADFFYAVRNIDKLTAWKF